MRTLVASVMMLASMHSTAADLSAFVEEAALGVTLSGVRFPEALPKDLASGLTTRILIRVTLEEAGRRTRQRSAEIAIRYDLWDEVFTLVTRLDGTAPETTTKRSAQDVRASLDQIRLARLFSTADIGVASELTVHAELLLNPIDRERMENLRRWVAENSARRSLDPAGILGAADASLANAVFNKIFEQYASGSDVAAAWQQRVSMPRFKLEALRHDGR
jgi:hypothetical protein